VVAKEQRCSEAASAGEDKKGLKCTEAKKQSGCPRAKNTPQGITVIGEQKSLHWIFLVEVVTKSWPNRELVEI